MPIVLLADQNTTWLERHIDAHQAIKSRGWEIKSVGQPSSGLPETTPDREIYRIAAANGWVIVTRDSDFFDLARSAKLNGNRVTDVTLLSDFMTRGEPVIAAIELCLSGGHAVGLVPFRASDLVHYIDPEFKQYYLAVKALAIAKAKNQAPPIHQSKIVTIYQKKYNFDPAQEKAARKKLRQQS